MYKRVQVGAAASAIVVAALLALAPAALGATGGGSVNNKAPTVTAFANLGSSRNLNTADVFNGTVKDSNLEKDVTSLRVTFVSAPAGVTTTTFTRGVNATHLAQASEPGAYDADGWKVWNPTANDGELRFKFQYTYTVNGTYVVRALAQDKPANPFASGPAADLTVSVVQAFTVDNVVSAAGADLGASGKWGNWTADPGAANVTALTYLKVRNTGGVATTGFTVDFTPASFSGSDAATAIGIDGNVRFACAETGSSSARPDSLSYDLANATVSSSGSRSVSFTAVGNILYCLYRIDALPALLVDQDYGAAYTVQ